MLSPKQYGFCAVSVWKRRGVGFAHFGLESGMVFEGTTRWRMNIQKEIIHANLVRWNCKKSFSLCSYLNNDDRIPAYAWFENGNGF